MSPGAIVYIAMVIVAVATACFLLDLLCVAVLFQVRKGRLDTSCDDASSFHFHTDLARVTVNRSKSVVKLTTEDQSREIQFDQIERLDFQLRIEWPPSRTGSEAGTCGTSSGDTATR